MQRSTIGENNNAKQQITNYRHLVTFSKVQLKFRVVRMGRSVGTTRNSTTESGRSRVQSQVAAGAKYGEFCFHPGRNPTVSHQKSVDKNLTMPTVERPSISSGFSQYSFLANPCKIDPVQLLLLLLLLLLLNVLHYK